VPRSSPDIYFLRIAAVVATRATCPRRAVGAVIVKDSHILATGYNGAPRGLTHCTESGCEIVGGHCVRAAHSEANALISAARHGTCIDKASMFVTTQPCLQCAKLIVNAGITRVVFGSQYGEEQGLVLLAAAGVLVEFLAI